MTPPFRRRFLVIGGGCYGTHYARAIARALERGTLPGAGCEVWIVDRDPACAASRLPERTGQRLVVSDWDDFFDAHLASWEGDARAPLHDLVVPAPLTPHLFARWLSRALAPHATIEEVEPPALPDLPFARSTASRLVFSHAAWRCPTHCVEPATCPATRQPRSWDMTRTLVGWTRDLRAMGRAPLLGPLVARCTHLVEGVGVYPVEDWVRAARRIAGHLMRNGPGADCYALAATVSGCHGAASLLALRSRALTGRA